MTRPLHWMSSEELLDHWHTHRNAQESVVAADEMMYRIWTKVLTVEPCPHLGDLDNEDDA